MTQGSLLGSQSLASSLAKHRCRVNALAAIRHGKPYTVISCDPEGRDQGHGIKNFPPLATLELPEYPEMKLFHPPFLEMLHFCYQEDFTHLHAATPGPMGLAALAAARLLKLPLFATYHTAIPQYAEHLTGDAGLVEFLWKYLLWFFEQTDCIFVPSRSSAEELTEKGSGPTRCASDLGGVDLKRSTTGTFGNVVLEAQASGIPVIVSDVGGPRENVISGETGLVVPATEESLTRAVLELVVDPRRLREMGRAARRYVESRALADAFLATWEMYGAAEKGTN
jgi:glycosyltransferase involved in cell wall biosynthesis